MESDNHDVIFSGTKDVAEHLKFLELEKFFKSLNLKAGNQTPLIKFQLKRKILCLEESHLENF
jgi:hypothetical protein